MINNLNTINPYILYPSIIAAIVVIILLTVILAVVFKKKSKKIKVDDAFINELVLNYGGIDNIKSVMVDNARLKVTVINLDNVNLEALKKSSQAGVFVTSNTIKTLFKIDSVLIKNSIEKIMRKGA